MSCYLASFQGVLISWGKIAWAVMLSYVKFVYLFFHFSQLIRLEEDTEAV